MDIDAKILNKILAIQIQQHIKKSYTIIKLLTVWIITHHEKFLNRWSTRPPLPVSGETCMWVKKQHLESDMEEWTGSKLGKEYNRVIYCHHAYLTYMLSTRCEMPDWNQDCQEKYPTISDMQIIPL